MNNKKKVFTGFVTGLAANGIGVLVYVLLFSELSVWKTLRMAYQEGFLGSVIALGAILNLFVFFWFIRKRRDYHARGVLMATLVVAVLLLFYKVFL